MSMNHSSSYERSSIERRHTTQARRADSASPPHHRSICSNSASVEHSDDCLWLRKHPRQHTAHAAQLAHGAPSPCWPQPASLRRCAAQASFSIAAGTGATGGTQQMRHSLRYRQDVLAKVSAAQGRGADELRATAHDEAGAAAQSRGAANGPRRTGSPSVEPSNLTVERRRRTTRALGCRTPAHHGLTRVNTGLGAGAPRSMPPGDLRLQRWRSRIKGIHQGAAAPWTPAKLAAGDRGEAASGGRYARRCAQGRLT